MLQSAAFDCKAKLYSGIVCALVGPEMNPALYLIHLCILLISLIGCVVNRKDLHPFYSFFLVLLSTTWVVESVSFVLLLYTSWSTQIIYHLFLPVCYSLHALIYAKAMNNKMKSRIIYYTIPTFIIIHIVLSTTIQPVSKPNSYAFLLAAALLVAMSLAFLHQVMKEPGVVPIQRQPLFWTTTGNLFFFCGAAMLMGLLNYLLDVNKPLASRLFTINYLLNYMLYGLYCIGFFCRRKWKMR
jgi:hypothetical protein